MRLASSSFMYQGETMGSGDFMGSLCTGDRQNSRFCILQRGQKGSRANSSVFLAKPALKARGQRASRAKFIREIPDIPSRARPKTSRPASWHARLWTSSPRYYRSRELRASSGRGPFCRSCSGARRARFPRLRPGLKGLLERKYLFIIICLLNHAFGRFPVLLLWFFCLVYFLNM